MINAAVVFGLPPLFQEAHVRADEQEVINAALRWWHTKRPLNFTEEQHLLRPTTKITTQAERELCEAVAHHIRMREATS